MKKIILIFGLLLSFQTPIFADESELPTFTVFGKIVYSYYGSGRLFTESDVTVAVCLDIYTSSCLHTRTNEEGYFYFYEVPYSRVYELRIDGLFEMDFLPDFSNYIIQIPLIHEYKYKD